MSLVYRKPLLPFNEEYMDIVEFGCIVHHRPDASRHPIVVVVDGLGVLGLQRPHPPRGVKLDDEDHLCAAMLFVAVPHVVQ